MNANAPNPTTTHATPAAVDATHHPDLRSWVASANTPGTDFPIQNLPFGRFRLRSGPLADGPWRLGVAIGDQVLDLCQAGVLPHGDMARLLASPPAERRALRQVLSAGLAEGSPHQAEWANALVPQADVVLGLPCDVGDYTDFYIGIHHATAVGKLFRPDNPLLPNYKWVPIGYHGRASTLLPSGQPFVRPQAQIKRPDAAEPVLAPTQRLDYELEMAVIVGPGNPLGQPIAVDAAEAHIFGLTLLNDWSARDVQAWEYQPLGPFLSKNFASTLSPWVVTLEALAPFRQAPAPRPAGDPAPLPYLQSQQPGTWAIELEVWLLTPAMVAAGTPPDALGQRLVVSRFTEAAYWTLAQLLAHHTVNGCSLQPGDVLGTGTLSGPQPQAAGSLLELTQGGAVPVVLDHGEQRQFLQDGDVVTLRAVARASGARTIGFGQCRAQVLPAGTRG